MKNIFKSLLICGFLTVSSAFASSSSEATYRVPVEAELEGANDYALENFEFVRNANGTYLAYDLPAALVGHAGQRVEFFGKPGAKNLVGKDGGAECRKLGAREVCHVELISVGYDPRAISEVLGRGFSHEEFVARMQVAKKFAGNPVAFVIYK